MKQTIERSASDPCDSGFVPFSQGAPSLDVPGMLASRVGDLYAAEELLHRKERTDRLMHRVTTPAEK